MAIYGVDQYGKTVYGADLGVDYTVTDLSAVQSDYGRITVSWNAPRQNNWTSLVLVRSGYGFPVAPTDGVTLASWPSTGARTSYSDVGLSPGYWYYTVFATVPLAAWSPSLTYQSGDRVSYSGQNWVCLVPYSLNIIPGSNGAVWAASYETQLWHPAGSVACLSVADHGYGALLEELVPSPYKASPGTSTDSGTANPDLTAFLAVLGFGFAQMQQELDDLLHAYEVTTTRQDRLAALSQTVGLSQELASSARFQRLRTLNAAAINQERGTVQGLMDSIYAASGLSASVATGPNLLLTQDQSAFVDPLPPQWQPAGTYAPGQEVLFQGVRYQCTGYSYSVTPSNYTGASLTAAPNALGTVTISSTTYVKEASPSGPASITVPFTVPANGTYYLSIDCAMGPDYGVLSVTVDGAAHQISGAISSGPFWSGGSVISVPQASLDLYAASAGDYGPVGTGALVLSAGSHTLVLNALTRNASASGYSIGFASVSVVGSPVLYPPGNPPSGGPNSAAQWSASAGANVAGYTNPVNGGRAGSWSPLANTAIPLVSYLGA